MNIFFIRHGQSMGNLNGDYSTNLHDNLSEFGLQQANKLVKRLTQYKFDKIYCSPLRRAYQTILPYVEKGNYPVEIWPELAEACWQEDKTINSIENPTYINGNILGDSINNLFSFRNADEKRPVEDETYSEGIFRLKEALKLIKIRHKDSNDNILIVGHAYAISRLIEQLLGMSPDGRIEHDNTGFSMLEENKDKFTIQFINRC